ncbi:MAG TPA: tetratricopeptide repeat protein, partial [Polyangia bacterium]
AITYGCIAGARRHPALAFAWLWFLVAPLPVIGLVQFGGQAFADRWTYLAHLGLVTGLVVTTHGLLQPRVRPVVAVVAVLACALVTARELPHWRNSEAIFRHTLAVAPDNFMAHTNLGNALDRAGELDEAAVHYEEAVRLNPTYPEALNNLGTLKARRGNMADAEALFRRALAVRPDMLLARYNLGLAASRFGRNLEATTEWLRVLAANAGDERARPSLTFVVTQVLAPACRAQALHASPAEAAAFTTALAGWRPIPADEGLRATLDGLGSCLRL